MSYVRGANRERQVQRQLETLGWVVTRCAGSRGVGAYDLHCSKAGQPTRLVQVKATARTPFQSFLPKARRELLACAEKAGAEAWLVHWPPDRRGARWIPSLDWPA